MIISDEKFRRTCILLSGGIGTRLGASCSKQYIEVNGKSIIEYTLECIKAWETMDSLIIVANEQWHDYLNKTVSRVLAGKIRFLGFAEPGKNRQLSILNAMKAIENNMAPDAVVMIHDAVRPLLSSELINRCNDVIDQGEGVMPYLPVKDTIYLKDENNKLCGMIQRDSLAAGQTPEFFDYWKYLEANEALSEEEILTINGSSEPAVLSKMNITLVPGDEGNFKITTPADLERFTAIIMGAETV